MQRLLLADIAIITKTPKSGMEGHGRGKKSNGKDRRYILCVMTSDSFSDSALSGTGIVDFELLCHGQPSHQP